MRRCSSPWAHISRSDSEIESPPSARLPAVVDALTYLNEALNGDAPATGRRVVVVGGGNAAIDAARTARRLGAEEVRLVYRRQREAMPALTHEIDEAEMREGVELLLQLQPVKLDDGGIVCVRTEPGSARRVRPAAAGCRSRFGEPLLRRPGDRGGGSRTALGIPDGRIAGARAKNRWPPPGRHRDAADLRPQSLRGRRPGSRRTHRHGRHCHRTKSGLEYRSGTSRS